ncbi:MAG: TenA family protein [Alphaproteobacteria bacterium]|jgi:thiaminase/transcriptional activator TenA|nr:TenA family protein [Alphaproteobacteria bacterium]
MAEPGFSEILRERNRALWDQATGHRFCVELGDDSLAEAVYRRYLIQDYAFVEALVSMVAFGVARAPTMAAKAALSQFLAAVTSEENTYFLRSFEALGVSEAERDAPTLMPVSQEFLAAMRDAGAAGDYESVLATLLPAEWIYLTWAKAQAEKAPKRFYLREWIELHANPEFEAFVMWLKAELDRAGPRLAPARRADIEDRFRRMVALEVAFFDAAYQEPMA